MEETNAENEIEEKRKSNEEVLCEKEIEIFSNCFSLEDFFKNFPFHQLFIQQKNCSLFIPNDR
jgi:hypothetical protein